MSHSTDPEALAEILAAGRWDEAVALLTDPTWLEIRAGQPFDLAEDFLAALEIFPEDHPQKPFLRLLTEALLRNLHFIARHPSTLFQCLWNSGWWYDSPQVSPFLQSPPAGKGEFAPWERLGPRLSAWLEQWRTAKEAESPGFPWVRSLRPPLPPLGGAQWVVIPVDTKQLHFRSLYFAEDGRLVAWFGPAIPNETGPLTVSVWEAETGRPVSEFPSGAYPLRSAALSADGRWQAAVGGSDGGWGKPVRLIDEERGAEVASFPTPDHANINKAVVSANGKLLAATGYGGEEEGHLFVWDVDSGECLPSSGMLSDGAWALALSPDGERVAVGLSDGPILVREVRTGRETATLVGHSFSSSALAFSADGRRLASGASDGTVRTWDLAEVTPVLRQHGHPDAIVDAVFATDGRRLVTVSVNGTTWLWNGLTGAPVANLHASTHVVMCGGYRAGAIFADGQRVVSVAHDPQGRNWEALTGRPLSDIPEEEPMFIGSRRIAFSPSGEWFVAVSRHEDGLALYRTGNAVPAVNLQGHQGEIRGFCFSGDGRRIVSGSEDGTVRVWDVAEGRELVCFQGHEGEVFCVGFSPDGKRVVSGGVDRTVRVWDIKLGRQLACLVVPDPGVCASRYASEQNEQLTEGVSGVAFAADGMHVLTLSEDHRAVAARCRVPRIRLWDPFVGVCLGTIEGEADLRAIALGRPYRAVAREAEVVVEDARTGEAVGWLPCPLGWYRGRQVVTAPSGRGWAVVLGPNLLHFVLEGERA
jgi:WD40 repeat protein